MMIINNNDFIRHELFEIKPHTTYKINFTSNGTFYLQFAEGRMESQVVKPLTKPLKGIADTYHLTVTTVNGGMLFLMNNHKNKADTTWTHLLDFTIEEVI
jgi:hypothetical protein